MADHATQSPALCTHFHRAIELIGRRWTGAIIYVLLQERCRFAGLRAAIPEITDRMLSDRLQELEREGIVERTVVPETPVRVEYALTAKGRALAEAMDAITAWAATWISRDGMAATTAAPATTGGSRGAARPASAARHPRRTSGPRAR